MTSSLSTPIISPAIRSRPWISCRPGRRWGTDVELSGINKGTPPWRRLQPDIRIGPVLFDAVYQMTKLEPPDHLKWILSFNPLIVGIDSTAETEQPVINFNGAVAGNDKIFIGYNQHLVTDPDLTRTIGKLYIQNPWDAAPNNAVILLLPTNPTIAELFREHLQPAAIPPPGR